MFRTCATSWMLRWPIGGTLTACASSQLEGRDITSPLRWDFSTGRVALCAEYVHQVRCYEGQKEGP